MKHGKNVKILRERKRKFHEDLYYLQTKARKAKAEGSRKYGKEARGERYGYWLWHVACGAMSVASMGEPVMKMEYAWLANSTRTLRMGESCHEDGACLASK